MIWLCLFSQIYERRLVAYVNLMGFHFKTLPLPVTTYTISYHDPAVLLNLFLCFFYSHSSPQMTWYQWYHQPQAGACWGIPLFILLPGTSGVITTFCIYTENIHTDTVHAHCCVIHTGSLYCTCFLYTGKNNMLQQRPMMCKNKTFACPSLWLSWQFTPKRCVDSTLFNPQRT